MTKKILIVSLALALLAGFASLYHPTPVGACDTVLTVDCPAAYGPIIPLP